MGVLRLLRRVMDGCLEALVVVVMAALVLDVLWQVFTRFVMKDPSTWTDELATFLLVWASLLGAAVGLKRRAHLGMDYFVTRLAPGRRAFVEVLGVLCTGLFSLAVMTVGGAVLVAHKLHLQETSPALGLNLGYVYLALPISGLFLTMYSFDLLMDRVRAWSRGATVARAPE
jgi:TRAP-type C4-dicarboxylate transport system permease small subunit